MVIERFFYLTFLESRKVNYMQLFIREIMAIKILYILSHDPL